MRYCDYISINPIFQNSINLQFDLNDEEKIREYIPTREACEILKRYLASMVRGGEKNDRATVLYGPYGKGKSFLVLVLLYIVSADYSSQTYQDFLSKIGQVDTELSKLIRSFHDGGTRLLPVIINSDYDDLDQAFLIGLTEAQERSGLNHIVPKTSFDVAIDVINRWQNDDSRNVLIIDRCLEKQSISLDELKAKLLKKDVASYKSFCDFYACVSGGIPFNPLIRKNTASNLKTVAENLFPHYSGIFVVFDEFSKFIESGAPGLSQQLKVLQDSFEAATRSSHEAQIHICCVNHKKLSAYSKSVAPENISSFRTIEGRVREISFTRTMGENFSIIAKALTKKPAFERFWKAYSKEHEEGFLWYVERGFVEPESQEDLFKGCFPLNPLASFALIQLSEMVAQNERTLFTFISDNDVYSLNSFIHNHCDGTYCIDSLYDYFSPLFGKEEKSNTKNIWIKAESILSQIVEEEERKVIKAIAVSQILNETRLFPATYECLEKALSISDLQDALAKLEEKSFIHRDFISNQYSLSAYSSKEINRVIQDYRLSHRNVNVSEEIEKLSPVKFVPARRYNANYKMVRYYQTRYLDADAFCQLASIRGLASVPCDGVIVQVLLKNATDEQLVLEKYGKIEKDSCVVVGLSKRLIDQKTIDVLSDYCALRDICNSSKKADSLLQSEMMVLQGSMRNDLKFLIRAIFDSSSWLSETKHSYLSDIISFQLESTFPKTPIVNNELLNKHELTTTYRKSRNFVVDRILNGQIDFSDVSSTSAEMTVFNSVFGDNREDVKEVVALIRNEFCSLEGKKTPFSRITRLLSSAPYGIREGVMPLLVARAIVDLPDHFLLYFESKEIVLSAENLAKAIDKPEAYKFVVQKGSADKTLFLEKLASLFGTQYSGSFWSDLNSVVVGISRQFSMLPPIIRTGKSDDLLGVSKPMRKMISVFLRFDINRYEAVFGSLWEIFADEKTSSYSQISFTIEKELLQLNKTLPTYIESISDRLKELFGATHEESLKAAIETWYLTMRIGDKNTDSLSGTERRVLEVLCSDTITFLDSDVVNLLAKAATGTMVSDWQKDKQDELYPVVISLIQKLESADCSKNELEKISAVELSNIGKMAKKTLEAAMDEYGESITDAEKISILKALIMEIGR